jgi:hypothetical protein
MPDATHYTYRVTWSAEDGEHVATVAQFPSLSGHPRNRSRNGHTRASSWSASQQSSTAASSAKPPNSTSASTGSCQTGSPVPDHARTQESEIRPSTR